MEKEVIQVEIQAGKKAEWVDGFLKLVDAEEEQKKDERPITERVKTFEDACKELIESYLDMFKKELNIDEDDFRKFGAADNEKAQEFYQLLITDELPNADLWEVDTPFSDDEE